jgi:predicted dehydrogenase
VISAEAELGLDYRPRFPSGYRPGVALVGCGDIARSWHLPAYAKYDVRVVGVHDPVPAATEGIRRRFPFVERVYPTLEELLADDAVEIVDLATRPEVRPRLIRRAVEAGKHVLAQKPLALDLRAAQEVAEEAEGRGVRVAVNQNGRWSPPWRIATLLIEQGAIGDIIAVTHFHDRPLPPLVGTHFDELEHFVIYDYFVHWIDICRCWLDGKRLDAVRALDYRAPDQPSDAKSPWAAWVELHYEDGTSALIRNVGEARTKRPACPFWVHGTGGTIRGSVLLDSDFVELERDGVTSAYTLEGAWYPDGFAGALGELVSAIAEDREPYNSARHNLLTLAMTFAACRSAEQGGRPVTLDELSA